ncbi:MULTISPECIES: anaerobic ribonucleoside-triphosphate reductase activating protein [Sulfurimonas]|uniref:anaerobic ribonucleoside-triphosphate reductase activating protein n=1 Tax=Sulfurimonas TaxID=202746 RepID=UPI001264C902|nr:anaerobic ribonucleoside-triphosphate reductase activating protein [Sulfurimonas indica]
MSINKECSLENDKVIYDITKFTHLDYPDHLAAIIWFSGCNMHCDYCYNKEIVFAKNGSITMQEALDFLQTRVSLLDGVVLSGGEATAYDLVEFCQKIKKMGFTIKLDTNGTYFDNFKELLELKLLDYVALDYKAPKEKFTQITHSRKYHEFSKTLDLLLASNIDFEVRTTLHADLLTPADINLIISDLEQRGYSKTYYIQEFLETKENIADIGKPELEFNKKAIKSRLNIIWR